VPLSDALPAIERNRHVERDAVHPCGESAPAVKLFECPPEFNGDFLRQIFAVGEVLAIQIADLVEDLLVLLQQTLKSVL
jgi:hypothetical protein